MTDMSPPYDAICAAVGNQRDDLGDGSLHAVFLGERNTVLLTVGFDEGTRCVDELFLRHLVAVVTDLGVAAVVFAIMRASGQPARIDRLLWRELSARLAEATTRLADLIVVGECRRWSAVSGRTEVLRPAA